MLVQTNVKQMPNCEHSTCGDLKCPVGFLATEFPGHCCPYCYNPNIKVEALVKGATGEFGGKTSLHCPDVWCFPTLCTKPVSQPGSGECCETCRPSEHHPPPVRSDGPLTLTWGYCS